MLIIPLNLDPVLLLLHNSKLAYCLAYMLDFIVMQMSKANRETGAL